MYEQFKNELATEMRNKNMIISWIGRSEIAFFFLHPVIVLFANFPLNVWAKMIDVPIYVFHTSSLVLLLLLYLNYISWHIVKNKKLQQKELVYW